MTARILIQFRPGEITDAAIRDHQAQLEAAVVRELKLLHSPVLGIESFETVAISEPQPFDGRWIMNTELAFRAIVGYRPELETNRSRFDRNMDMVLRNLFPDLHVDVQLELA